MAEFGAHLRKAREDRGVTLRQIATTTKISMVALEALEREDFSRLPGGIFSRAFVRAYALEVGLEPDQTVAAFVQEYDKAASRQAERIPRPEVTADDREFLERQHRASIILRWVIIALVLIVIAGLVLWQVRWGWLASATPSASPTAAEAAATQTASPPVAAPSSVPSAQGPSPGEAGPVAGSPAAAVTTTGTAQAAPDEADRVSLHVAVTEDCWIRVRVDGAVVFAELLRAGAERDVRPGREVLLDVGNAGAVKWTVNGRSARSLGRRGQTGSARLTKDTISQYVQ